MNFTSQRFLSLSICEYPTLEGDLSSSKERPEANPIIGVKRSLSFYTCLNWKLTGSISFKPDMATRRSFQPIRRYYRSPGGVLHVHTMHQQPLDQEDPHLLKHARDQNLSSTQEDPKEALLSIKTVQVQERSDSLLGAKIPQKAPTASFRFLA
ncbi:hypothetical protein IGI04_025551 [Brassica rapa subsp. trilocularis]|uniref:Uncharacterized protein n=1 Tax=Brassica rapa subsp. trilocularis TaxID=1813537 RepID=A0ABQ7KTD2_BRACM|nr:hypothetical protein IGI04_025551 [Brassica rapa subsp. trilocularis]